MLLRFPNPPFSQQVNDNGKIPVVSEQTNVEHIYAIGDCTSVDVMFHESHWANPELTPVAVQVCCYCCGVSCVSEPSFGRTHSMPVDVFDVFLFLSPNLGFSPHFPPPQPPNRY